MSRAPKPAHSRTHTAGIVGALLGLAAAGTAAGVAVSRIAARRVLVDQLGPPTVPAGPTTAFSCRSRRSDRGTRR
jgi:hypothetical protein